jgi:hypothetical protein
MKIEYKLLGNKIDSFVLQTGGTAVYAEIEGECSIFFGKRLFLYEPFILLLEFAASLYKWRSTSRDSDYQYNSIESEYPLITFSKIEKDIWLIDSVWKKCHTIKTNEQDIMEGIDTFICSLNGELQLEYGIQVAQFVDYIV